MALITINCLTEAATLSGGELLPVWQNNESVRTPLSSVQSARGTGNSSNDFVDNNNSAIFGGENNTLCAIDSFIISSKSSSITASTCTDAPNQSFIAAGQCNDIGIEVFTSSIIASQCSSITCANTNAIVGSHFSSISGSGSALNNVIIGGCLQKIEDTRSGILNLKNSAIIGGYCNQVYGNNNLILAAGKSKAGKDAVTCNSACFGYFSLVIGGGAGFGNVFGYSNEAVSNFSTVINGTQNCAIAMGSTVLGGCNNKINCHGSGCAFEVGEGGTIIGGNDNTIICGHKNSTIIGGSNMNSVSSNMLHTQSLFLSADVIPTSDPGVRGVVWNDSGTLKISL